MKHRKKIRPKDYGPDPGFELYPIVIRQTRYSGLYEGGEWAAFPNVYTTLDNAAFGDDKSCSAYWCSPAAKRVGLGSTPQEAYEDLIRRNAYIWKKPPQRRIPRYAARFWLKHSPEGVSPNAIFFKKGPLELHQFEIDQDDDQNVGRYSAPKYPDPGHPNPKFG